MSTGYDYQPSISTYTYEESALSTIPQKVWAILPRATYHLAINQGLLPPGAHQVVFDGFLIADRGR